MKNEIKLAKIAKLELNGYSDQAASNKDVYLRLGRRVLAALVKELGLVDYKIRINKAGPAVSGDVTLIGMWNESDGIYIYFLLHTLHYKLAREVVTVKVDETIPLIVIRGYISMWLYGGTGI